MKIKYDKPALPLAQELGRLIAVKRVYRTSVCRPKSAETDIHRINVDGSRSTYGNHVY